MLSQKIFAPSLIGLGLLVATTGAGHAATLTADCTAATGSPGALGALVGSIVMGTSVTVQGTCVGNIQIMPNGVTLQADGSVGGEIVGQVSITGTGATLIGLTIDGTLASTYSTDGVVVQPGGSATLSNCTIQHWPGRGVVVDMNAAVGISGGSIKFNTGTPASGGAAITIKHGSSATIGFAPPFYVEAFSNAAPVEIASNNGYGIDVENNAQVEIYSANIHDNGGPELYAMFSNVNIQGGTISAPVLNGPNAIQLVHSSIYLYNTTVTGAGPYTIADWGTSMLAMRGSTVTQTGGAGHTALQVTDGSTAASLGGNTVSASGGSAIFVQNASTFHETNGTSFGFAAAGDTITGSGTVQVQSNMELGTGGTAPSAWTGAILVAQNSSFRMDGGMTITGAVSIAQASNAFFNVTNGGKNVVTGGVNCTGVVLASHVAAPGNVVTSINGSTSAVTIGSTGPACLSF